MKRILTVLSYVMLLGSTCLFCTTAQASFLGWRFSPGLKKPNSEFAARAGLAFHDDITPDQDVKKMKLTQAQQHQALVWGLSQDEEKRYVALMQNRSGYYYNQQKNQVSPVEVLGFNARTDQARARYAEMDAKQQFQHTAKYFAYNAAYIKASSELKAKLKLPVLRPFNTAKFSPFNYQPMALKPGDHLVLFTGLQDEVKPITSALIESIERVPNLHLQVYFVGHGITKAQIEHWALAQNIPVNYVTNHQISLNFNQGQWARVNTTRHLPVLLLKRGGQTQFVDMERF